MIGMKIIGEMTKDEMIEELLAGQRILYDEQSLEALKHYVIQSRMVFTQRNLTEEAKLECQSPKGFFGMFGSEEDE